MPLDAYQDARKYFLDHTEYTHLVVCPDDLEVTQPALDQLVADIEKYRLPVISGMCNMDENQPETYNIQALGISYEENHPPMYKHSWIKKDVLPKDMIFEVGFAGFGCEFIERDIMESVSFRGAADDGQSNMDWQFTRECVNLGYKIFVDQRVNLWHRRTEQWAEAKAFKAGKIHVNEGHEIFIKGHTN